MPAEFRNEPFTDFSKPENKKRMEEDCGRQQRNSENRENGRNT